MIAKTVRRWLRNTSARSVFEGGVTSGLREIRVSRILSELDGRWIIAMTWFNGGAYDGKTSIKICKKLPVEFSAVTPLAFKMTGVLDPLGKDARVDVRFHAVGNHRFVRMLDDRAQGVISRSRLERALRLGP